MGGLAPFVLSSCQKTAPQLRETYVRPVLREQMPRGKTERIIPAHAEARHQEQGGQ